MSKGLGILRTFSLVRTWTSADFQCETSSVFWVPVQHVWAFLVPTDLVEVGRNFQVLVDDHRVDLIRRSWMPNRAVYQLICPVD